MTAIAKITSKGQTTIPREVREALKAAPGDLLAWDVDPDGTVRVRRLRAIDLEYLRAVEQTVREEWNSPEDEEAYRDL